MIDVSALVGDIPTSAVTLRTYGATTIDGYGETSATPTEVAMLAVVHPATPEQRTNLPEAYDRSSAIAVYTTTAIAGDGTRRPAEIEYPAGSGEWYLVHEIEDYGILGGIYLHLATWIGPTA